MAKRHSYVDLSLILQLSWRQRIINCCTELYFNQRTSVIHKITKTSTDMGFLKLLLHIGLILATITDFCIAADSEFIYRLPNTPKPLHYDITLICTDFGEGNDTFHGKMSVILDVFDDPSNISLHSQDLEINLTATTLIEPLTYNKFKIWYKPTEQIYNNVTNTLTLYFGQVLRRGFYTLNMEFVGHYSKGSYDGSGLLKISYTDEEGDKILAATLLEPNGARRIFPCWDEPAYKATFLISVMHRQKYTVVSNMPMRSTKYAMHDPNYVVWSNFSRTPIMSTYLVGIVIVPNNFVHVQDIKLNSTGIHQSGVWCKPSLINSARFVYHIAEKVTPLLVEYTNTSSSEKISKINHVILQNYPVNGMESWGIIIYKEEKVVYDESTDPTFRRREVASLITHELVHQWFGNLVTPSWWSHVWLSEGFAMFFQSYFLDKIYKDWRMMDSFVVWNLRQSLLLDVGLLPSVTLTLNNNDFERSDIFNLAIYDKAAAILRMLYYAVGEDVFQKGIRKYLATCNSRSTTPDDLWSAMQEALEQAPYARDQKFRIKEVMDTWMNQKGYPVLNVTKNYETYEVSVTQKCVGTTECVNNKWWIPMTFAAQGIVQDFHSTMPNNWLGPDQTSRMERGTIGWIIVNVQQTAYCRVYYDLTTLRKIIFTLNTKYYTTIHVLNRAQIIDDVYYFLQEGQLDSIIFHDLIKYLRHERDYVAWRPMFQILNKFSRYYLLPESEGFKSHMRSVLNELLQHVGYEENPDDDDITKLLRIDATKWACTVGHAECKRRAADKLSEHLADPDTHKVPQWWQEWTYCFGLTIANRTTWDKMMELYQRTSEKKLWKILSCAEDSDIIINYLNIITSNTTLFNNREHLFIFSIILQNHAHNDVVLDYILAHFNNIKPKLFPTSLTIKNIILNVFSNEQMSKVKKFAETNLHQEPNTLSDIINLLEKRKNDLKQSTDILRKRFGDFRLHSLKELQM